MPQPSSRPVRPKPSHWTVLSERPLRSRWRTSLGRRESPRFLRALAILEGIEADLLTEWERSIPVLAARSEAAAVANARKAWRFVGEMEEIASTFAGAGLPDGFALAAREIYQRLERFKDASNAPSLAEVVGTIINAKRAPALLNTPAVPYYKRLRQWDSSTIPAKTDIGRWRH